MPAVVGEIRQSLYNGGGVLVFVIYQFYVNGSGVLRDVTVSTPDGNKTGALVVDNRTARPQRIAVVDSSGTELRSFNIPANGTALTVTQLAGQGVTTIRDLAGLSPALT